MYTTITMYKASHMNESKTEANMHLKNRITNPRIFAPMLPPFPAPQFSKWAAYLKSRKKSKFFEKIFFSFNFVQIYSQDLRRFAIGPGHIRPTMSYVLSLDFSQNERFFAFLAQNEENERPVVSLIWPGRIANRPRSCEYIWTKLNEKKIF